jgi:PAS domain S-box-containing protein
MIARWGTRQRSSPCSPQDSPLTGLEVSAREGDWSSLFSAAFRQSKNPMVLLDSARRQVDVNVAHLQLLGYSRDELVGRPIWEFNADERISEAAWQQRLSAGHFTGETSLRGADGGSVAVQWAATVESVTGRRLVLFVALSTARWGRRFRRVTSPEGERGALTGRELMVVRLVALGNTSREIAEELHISQDTVRTHVRNAMEKVGARSRAQLVAKALGHGHALS